MTRSALAACCIVFIVLFAANAVAAKTESPEEAKQPDSQLDETRAKTTPPALTQSIGVFIVEDPYVVFSAATRLEITKMIERLATTSGKYELKRFPEEIQRFPARERCDVACRVKLAEEQQVDFFVSFSTGQMGNEVYLSGELTKVKGKTIVRSASVKVVGGDNSAHFATRGIAEQLFLANFGGPAVSNKPQRKDYEPEKDPVEEFSAPPSVNTVKLGFASWESITLFALQHEMSWGGRGGYFYLILPNLNLTGDVQQFGLGLGYKYRWYLNVKQFHPELEIFGGLDTDYVTYKFEYHEFYPAARYGGGVYYQFKNDLGLGFELAGVSGRFMRAETTSHKLEFLIGLHY